MPDFVGRSVAHLGTALRFICLCRSGRAGDACWTLHRGAGASRTCSGRRGTTKDASCKPTRRRTRHGVTKVRPELYDPNLRSVAPPRASLISATLARQPFKNLEAVARVRSHRKYMPCV